MKKIIFYDLNNNEILDFSEFDLKYIQDIPHIFDYEVYLEYDIFKIRKKIGANLADFESLILDLKKMLEVEIHKFYFYPSIDESFQIIFEISDKTTITVNISIRGNYSVSKFEFQYKMKLLQIPELIEQLDELLHTIKNNFS